MKKLPIVAIVGRPNVGKSTLFNRITKSRKAIVDDSPGITRDRNYKETYWSGTEFIITDTGGYDPKTKDIIAAQVKKQVESSIREADVIIFLLDLSTGITDLDFEINRILIKNPKKVITVINKVDNAEREFEADEFYKLGAENIFKISALIGRSIGDLLDEVISNLELRDSEDEEEGIIKFVVAGKPNVGKSSFVNAVTGEERSIVTNIPSTTRDSIDSEFKRNKQKFKIVDTAGLRKKYKEFENVEYYANLRTIKSIEAADIILVIVDVEENISVQDLKIIDFSLQKGKSVIIGLNKWDLIEDKENHVKKVEEHLNNKLKLFDFIPYITISVLNKTRIWKVVDLIEEVYSHRNQRIETSVLNGLLRNIIEKNPPPHFSGKQVSIKYITQVKTSPPVFVLFVNEPKGLKTSYKRFLENKIREKYPFTGTPMILQMRKRK
ncbi:ribosome biogenesis GTPase Der [candidate division KSB1 bacterium]